MSAKRAYRGTWKARHRHNDRTRVAIRYRAYPTDGQRQRIAYICGACRFVQNLAKEQRDLARRYSRHRPSYSSQSADLKELRNEPDLTPWLAEAPMQILQQALKDTDIAYRRFLSGVAGYPRWAAKRVRQSFRDPQHVSWRRISCRWAETKIQGVGWVRVRAHRPLIGSRICSATVVLEADGKVFISVLVEKHHRRPTKPRAPEGSETGVDRGVAVAVATSDEELVDRENWSRKEIERLHRLERKRERQRRQRGHADRQRTQDGGEKHCKSRNQTKTEHAIAALHSRARRRRADFVEQTSTDLAKNHRLICFEDLHIPAMTAAARRTVEHPGRNVIQKAGLNRAILDKGWAALANLTAHKAISFGHGTIAVPAPGTSFTCPNPRCGYVDPANRASRSVFVCLRCGYQATPTWRRPKTSVSGGSNSLSPVERR